MTSNIAVVPITLSSVKKMDTIKVDSKKKTAACPDAAAVQAPITPTQELVLAVAPAVAAEPVVIEGTKTTVETEKKACPETATAVVVTEATTACDEKAATTKKSTSRAGRYAATFFISAIIFFLLFLLLKPNYLMNIDEAGRATYNWWKIVLAALISALIVLLIVWAASALTPCK